MLMCGCGVELDREHSITECGASSAMLMRMVNRKTYKTYIQVNDDSSVVYENGEVHSVFDVDNSEHDFFNDLMADIDNSNEELTQYYDRNYNMLLIELRLIFGPPVAVIDEQWIQMMMSVPED